MVRDKLSYATLSVSLSAGDTSKQQGLAHCWLLQCMVPPAIAGNRRVAGCSVPGMLLAAAGRSSTSRCCLFPNPSATKHSNNQCQQSSAFRNAAETLTDNDQRLRYTWLLWVAHLADT